MGSLTVITEGTLSEAYEGNKLALLTWDNIHHILCRGKTSSNCSTLKLLDMNLLTPLEFLRDTLLIKETENSLD